MLRNELLGLGFAIVVLGLAGACATGNNAPGSDGEGGQGGDPGNTVATGNTTGQTTGNTNAATTGNTNAATTGNTNAATTGTGAGCGSDFTCNDQSCQPASYECDGVADCPDSSDEAPFNPGCPADTCDPILEFDCGDGSCTYIFWTCDGFNDCANGSDESVATCPPPVPPPIEWTCNANYYGDAGCDCGCGAVDIDCADATVASCEYCSDTGSCSTTSCPGTIHPTNNAVCM